MTIAIMQPYFLPYFGYFQLIHSVDSYILYNDVQFMKQGWINRNRILINDKEQFITVPLLKISSNKMINETQINHNQVNSWLKKSSKSIQQSYNKAPYLDVGINILNAIAANISNFTTVDQLNKFTIEHVCSYLEIATPISDSSNLFTNNVLKGPNRVLDICKSMSANRYINAIGGRELYSKETFLSEGIQLGFLESQVDNEAYSYSILHTIMVEDKEQIQNKLNSYHVS